MGLERRLFWEVFSEPTFVFLLLTFALFPVAERSVFGLPMYWAETMLFSGLAAWLWADGRSFRIRPSTLFFTERRFFFFLALFLLGIVIALLSNPHSLSSWGNLKSFYLAPILFFVAILRFGETIGCLEWFGRAWLGGIAAASLAALGAALSGWWLYDGRLAGPYSSANYLAMLVAPGSLLAMYFLSSAKTGASRWLFGLGLLSILATLWMTHSYAAWLALGAALGAMLIFGRKSFRPGLLFGTILLIIVTAFFFQESGSAKWQSLVSGSDRSSLASRVVIWQVAVKMAVDSFPFGIGTGRFQTAYLAYQTHFPPYLEWAVPTPHNLYLHFLLEGGVLSLIGWFGCIGILFWRYIRSPLNLEEAERFVPLSILGLSLVVFYLAYGLIDTPYMKNDLALAVWGALGFFFAALRLSGMKNFGPKA